LRNHTVWILLQTGAKFNQKRPQTEEMAKFKRFCQKSKGQREIFCLNDGTGRENVQEFCRWNGAGSVSGENICAVPGRGARGRKVRFFTRKLGRSLRIAAKTKDSGPLGY
jgi:hypothetical protein